MSRSDVCRLLQYVADSVDVADSFLCRKALHVDKCCISLTMLYVAGSVECRQVLYVDRCCM